MSPRKPRVYRSHVEGFEDAWVAELDHDSWSDSTDFATWENALEHALWLGLCAGMWRVTA